MRTIDWVDGRIHIIDQTLLPGEEVSLSLETVEEVAEAISSLRVRGAPALGVAGGLGVALAARRAREDGEDVGEAISRAASLLASTRPTAVNLRWGIERVEGVYDPSRPESVEDLIREARAMVEEDEKINRLIGEVGAGLIEGGSRVLTHCNAGALACVAHGTALSIVKVAHERGLVAGVTATETRPLLQGSRLTAWELKRMGVPHRVTIDSGAAGLIASGSIDVVVTGADRIAANGDVANKVGTYPLALAANASGVPFVVAAPLSTIDLATPDGGAIPIEERSASEVLEVNGLQIAPEGTEAYNPAFDVTPASLVSAIVTEAGIVRPGVDDLRTLFEEAPWVGETTG
ncbi:MAG: S-methyl-5-thioribose-1-phosphate isomerase [Actinomycetota bacterium]|nr:S-methyl-5-thioribose-1-phosphate isomerase [Actinomycetota bacterium]MDP9484750.1 S-methyl-5-thioribose-1-phosphate isomerase [Actinomycetota bacterium]PLS85287.1 MAG: S-methyl-5-thioribose-1-phosphate isomerase [Actinomycetota bacterium]